MVATSLFADCGLAFLVVFALLAFLAFAMRLITGLFPSRDEDVDPAIAAVISTTVAAVYHGARVTRIEEQK